MNITENPIGATIIVIITAVLIMSLLAIMLLLVKFFLTRKKLMTPGMEVAGIVEQVGNNATKFKVGDAVYGDISQFGFGSFAEFLCIDEKALALKPDTMKFEEDPDNYFEEQGKFLKVHPIPVDLVNYCSDECPMFILAVPRTVLLANRGYPQIFDPDDIVRITPGEHASIIRFCKKYDIDMDNEYPNWHLSSSMG